MTTHTEQPDAPWGRETLPFAQKPKLVEAVEFVRAHDQLDHTHCDVARILIKCGVVDECILATAIILPHIVRGNFPPQAAGRIAPQVAHALDALTAISWLKHPSAVNGTRRAKAAVEGCRIAPEILLAYYLWRIERIRIWGKSPPAFIRDLIEEAATARRHLRAQCAPSRVWSLLSITETTTLNALALDFLDTEKARIAEAEADREEIERIILQEEVDSLAEYAMF